MEPTTVAAGVVDASGAKEHTSANPVVPHSGHRLSPAEAANASIDAASFAHYARVGWCVVRDFLPASELDDLQRWTDELCGAPEVVGGHMLYREPSLLDPDRALIQRIENFCPFHAGFDAAIRRGRIARTVEALLGESAVLFKEKINFKMAGGAGFEPHQDQQAGWSAYAPMFVTAMVTLDDATIENGCLEFASMPRLTGLIGREWAPLTDAELDRRRFEPLPTRAGDVVFFDSFVAHASKPNRTGEQRRVLYLTYNAARLGDHRARYFADKRASFPPDIERETGAVYRFRV